MMMENYFVLLPTEAIVFLTWWQHDMPTRNTVAGESAHPVFGLCSHRSCYAGSTGAAFPTRKKEEYFLFKSRKEGGKSNSLLDNCSCKAIQPSGSFCFQCRTWKSNKSQALPAQHLRTWKQGFVVQLPSGETTAPPPSDFKESKTLVYAGRILS